MDGIETKTLDLGKFRIAYRDSGPGPTLTVVLLHGFCGSSAYWRRVMPQLGRHCRVIAPDLRGHGLSGLPDEPAVMEHLADDIAALLKHLDTGPVFLFGHSLGGYVTLAFYERHPQACRAFGLVHSTALPDTAEAKQNRLSGIAAIREQGIRPFVDNLIPKLFSPGQLANRRDILDEALQIGYGTSPEGACLVLDGMRQRPDRQAVLERAAVPVLLLAGRDDQIVPVERMFTVHRPHIRQTVLEDTGHMSMMEAPDACAAALLAFIRSVSAGSA